MDARELLERVGETYRNLNSFYEKELRIVERITGPKEEIEREFSVPLI